MPVAVVEKSKVITELLNGTNVSFKTIIPLKHEFTRPKLLGTSLQLQFGILIGITGDIKARLVLMGDPSTFSLIAKSMFGMELEGEMLVSFSGELGNMLAGSISSQIINSGIKTDITAPTIMQGNTKLVGYEKAIHLSAIFSEENKLELCLLLD
ncbi:chemotaxis protein CheX [Niallia sp. Krafla_26]|uniref:chemotaxis protein CheX n=1 Tax=Niallia sp. Krafla_26 TaxID=3064703 RepID=UPI003D16D5C2